ncbi:hypothetical protein AGMMS49593_10460 [Endomicrobiia bacterium]|nr:hypothetical protein AGMMS49593_10460 [Endomicrobiia bacterium]
MPLLNNPDPAVQAFIEAIKNGDLNGVDIKNIPIQKEYIEKALVCMNRINNNGAIEVIKELGLKLLKN